MGKISLARGTILVLSALLVVSFFAQPMFFVAAHSGDNGAHKIHACQLTLLGIVGIVRVIDVNSTCNGGETPLHWMASPEAGTGHKTILTGGLSYIGDRLAGKDFNGATVSNASFYQNVDISGTNFSNSLFYNTQFYQMVGDGLNMSGTTNRDITIEESSLVGANFSNSTFTAPYRILTSDMANANFSNTDVSGAEIRNSDLTDADFTGATITGVVWDNTVCPDGTNSNSNGNTCAGHL